MENLVIPSNFKLPVPAVPVKSALFSSEPPPKRTVSFSPEIRHRVSDSHLDTLCKRGLLSDAVSTLDSIAARGSKVKPDTYINLLQSCIDTNRIELGRRIHARLSLVEDVNPFVETKLVSMYAKCGYLDDARRVFDGMRERNLFTWSAMIGAFSREKKWNNVVEHFLMMVRDGVIPDRFLMPKILEACGYIKALEATKVIHSIAIRCGFLESVRVSNSILSVYSKCGKLNSAKSVLNAMEKRDAVSWNSIISGFFQKGQVEEATQLFNQMREEGTEPCVVTWNVMITGYNHSGEPDIAMGLMKKMESVGVSPDVFTWTAMISGLAHNNRRTQALESFKEMILEEVEPNEITIASAVSASASIRSLPMGMEIHAIALKLGLADEVLVGNSLVDMYCKCGDLDSAQRVFDKTSGRRDVYTWNTMIGGYCQSGYCGKAFELFTKMELESESTSKSKSTVAPNVITWNIMISGYIHNGDEDRAIELFQRMEEGGKVKRNAATWNALVAGYLSLGEKDKALSVFRHMSSNGAVPNLVSVLSVLPACANLVSANKVKEIHCLVLRRGLESEISVVNALLDTYAKSGNLINSRKVFDRIHQKDIISWNSIITGYVIHSHPNIALELYEQMKRSRLKPNRGTFLSVLNACALSGVVNVGKREFSSLSRDYNIVPSQEHYAAMVDLFGRKGRLGEAVEFIENMPTNPESSVWGLLLTASRVHRKPGLAILALDSLLELDPGNSSIQRLRLQADDQKAKIESGPAKRNLGRSWIELENRVYTFFTGDESEPYLNPWIREITEKVTCQTGLRDGTWLEEEEREDIVGFHSEKIAIGFALIGFPRKRQTLRIVKNLRMCGNCHETAKYISKLYGCEIYVSDSKCLHRFSDGQCSCGDYW